MIKALLLAGVIGIFQPSAPARILFIGNSLTYANDLPGMVCGLARASGRRVTCESVAKPDYGLAEHWNEKDARRAIARGWDIVVLQQGPSARLDSRGLLVDYVKRFDAESRKAGARTAIFMVWPSNTRRGDFSGVSESYSIAAKTVNGLLLPAGDAWRAAWALDPNLPLYGPDGFHPSGTGSYLAALVIFQQLFGEPAPELPMPGVAPADAGVLRRAVQSVLAPGP